MTGDEIMKAMRVAGFSERETCAMTYTSWKDGIDIEMPSHSLIAFVQLVERAVQQKTQTMQTQSQVISPEEAVRLKITQNNVGR